MCLIIHKPQGKSIPEGLLEDASDFNTDGWGALVVNKGKVSLRKSMNMQDVLDYYDPVYTELEVFLHLRKNTVGSSTIENLHPFQVNEHIYMFHNGTMRDVTQYCEKGESDSSYFARCLGKMPNIDIEDSFIQDLVNEFNGSANRVLLYDSRANKFVKLGKGAWSKWKGVEVSNKYSWTLHQKHYYTGSYSSSWYDGYYTSSTITSPTPSLSETRYKKYDKFLTKLEQTKSWEEFVRLSSIPTLDTLAELDLMHLAQLCANHSVSMAELIKLHKTQNDC